MQTILRLLYWVFKTARRYYKVLYLPDLSSGSFFKMTKKAAVLLLSLRLLNCLWSSSLLSSRSTFFFNVATYLNYVHVTKLVTKICFDIMLNKVNYCLAVDHYTTFVRATKVKMFRFKFCVLSHYYLTHVYVCYFFLETILYNDVWIYFFSAYK